MIMGEGLETWKQKPHHNKSIVLLSKELITGRGCPKLNIEEQRLRFLLEANFSGVNIAKTLGVSRSTFYGPFSSISSFHLIILSAPYAFKNKKIKMFKINMP